jgi:hypothetical protein
VSRFFVASPDLSKGEEKERKRINEKKNENSKQKLI